VNTVNGVPVNLSCETLEVARSGYYAWLCREPSGRHLENLALLPRIEAIHAKSKETYGSPRVTAELRAEGECVNEKRVARIMRQHEIAAAQTKKFKIQTTDSNHDLPIADRIFETEHSSSVMAPDQVYVGDITYIWTEEGFLFLAIFMDIFTVR
jgi:putative transposase